MTAARHSANLGVYNAPEVVTHYAGLDYLTIWVPIFLGSETRSLLQFCWPIRYEHGARQSAMFAEHVQ